MRPGARLQLTTLGMAYGPHAIARTDGMVVFVRGAAPQETVEAVVTEVRDRFAFADVAVVLDPSPQRRPAPCPALPRCGGCPWQHLDYAAQLAAKRRIVDDHLRRLAGLVHEVAPVWPSPREYGYRQRIKLRVGAGGALGFHAAASHDVVDVAHCLLAAPAVDAAIPAARALAERVPTLRRLELALADAEGRVVASGEVEGRLRAQDVSAVEAWLAGHRGVAGVVLRGRGWRREWGDVTVWTEPEADRPLAVRAPGFIQVNALGNRLLVDAVIAAVAPHPGQRVLDLYAGAGNLALALRRRGAQVTAVEQDGRAIADARRNAAAEPGAPLRAIAGRAERVAAALAAAGERFDAVVLDPPRAGAAPCIEPLLALHPPRLVYVSCDPATLARDLGRLRGPYVLAHVQPIDLFPHTYHLENVALLTRSCDPPPPSVSSGRRDEPSPASRRRPA